MKIHFKHKWKSDGFQDFGDFTKWFYKCECGKEYSSFTTKPEEIVGWLQFLIVFGMIGIPVIIYILFNLN